MYLAMCKALHHFQQGLRAATAFGVQWVPWNKYSMALRIDYIFGSEPKLLLNPIAVLFIMLKSCWVLFRFVEIGSFCVTWADFIVVFFLSHVLS